MTSPATHDAVAMWCVEQRQAWQCGSCIRVEAYLLQHPPLRDDTESILDLIYNEIVLREEAGESVTAEEYVQRFPELADPLRRLLAVHQAVVSGSECDEDPGDTLPPGANIDSRASPASIDPTAERETNRPIAGYEILEEIGRGGMGIVYRARQPGTQRIVALKVILSGRFASDDELTRFQTEAQAASRLEHAGIVPIYEVGRDGDLYYLSMAYVEGETLADGLTRGPLPPQRAGDMICELAQAVDAAHQQNVIHRDLKPQNILIDRDGRVRITDFGLARQDDRACSVTSTGQILGTPAYMPPEQARGQQDQVGPASDIYALGAILYCGLVGRPPFDGAVAVEVLSRVILDEPVSPRILNPAVPRDLETICLKCLEKDPLQRYTSASELVLDLQRFGNNEPIAARPVGLWGRLWRWSRRKPVIAGLIGSIAMLTAALIVGAVVAMVRLREENTRTIASLELATVAEGLANRRLFDSLIAQIQTSRRTGRPGQRLQSLAAVHEAVALAGDLSSGTEDWRILRNEAAACLTLTDVHPPELTSVLDHRRACFDPQSNRFAAWDGRENAIIIVDGSTMEQTHRWSVVADDIVEMRFSSDGRLLAVLAESSDSRQVLIGTTHHPDQPQVVLQPESGRVMDFDMTTDADRAILALDWGGLQTFDTRTGEQLQVINVGQSITGCRLSHAGDRVAVWLGPRMWLVSLDSGDISAPLHHETGGEIQTCAWSARDDLLATGGSDEVAVVWMATDKPYTRCVLEGHESWVNEVAFHPHTDVLMTGAGVEDATRLWNPWSGSLLLSLPGTAVGFSHDGRHLLGRQGRKLARQTVVSDHITRRFHTFAIEAAMISGQVSDDGQVIQTCAWDGFDLWDFSRGELCASQPLPVSLDAGLFPKAAFAVACSDNGVQRWPLSLSGTGGWSIGSAENLPLPPEMECIQHLECSDHGALAVIGHGLACVVARNHWPQFSPVFHHESADNCSVSPDGRWLATYGNDATGVRLWNVLSASLQTEPVKGDFDGFAQFSPCGRWLLVGVPGDYRIWSVGSWNESRPFTDLDQPLVSVAFRRDGRLLAAADKERRVQLVDVAAGRSLVSLPTDDRETFVCFHPDGTRLVCLGAKSGARIWDLARLRDALSDHGLDWKIDAR